MNKLLENMSIKLKISMLGAVGVLGILVAIGLFLNNQATMDRLNARYDVYSAQEEIAFELDEKLTETMIYIREFEINPIEANQTRVERGLTEVFELQASLANALLGHQVASRASIDAASTAITRFRTAFETYAAAEAAMGFTIEQGVRGELISAGDRLDELTAALDMPEIEVLVQRMEVYQRDYSLRQNPGYAARVDELAQAVRSQLSAASSIGALDRRAITDALQGYLAAFERYRAAYQAAHAAEEHMDELAEPAMSAINAMRDALNADMANVRAEVEAAGSRAQATLLTSATLLVLLIAAAAVLLTLDITRGLKRTVEQTRRLADGDLETEVTGGKSRSELGDLARALEIFKGNLQETRRLEAEAETKRNEDAARQEREMAKQERVVSDISAGLERLAAGDLTRPIDSPANNPFPAEYEALRNAYNEVVEQLAGIVSRIGSVAASVRGGSGEINAAAQDLSSRAETQAATLEQSAAALNELTESVRSTAQRAAAAEKASQDNRAHAETGAQVVREAVNAMRGIEKSSEQITRIIGVIDDIAFQTNLLALNAGVEAARAGEAGRGFAVVASEVRGLAQRASESAREIKALIQESTEQVEVGSALVGRTGESLEEILKRASEVSGLVAEISGAASEQASGLDEINSGVNQLDQVTQQNAAVAEETTAAATSLLQKAEELTQELSGFQIAGGGTSHSARLAPVADLSQARAARATAPAPRAAAAGERPVKASSKGPWQDF